MSWMDTLFSTTARLLKKSYRYSISIYQKNGGFYLVYTFPYTSMHIHHWCYRGRKRPCTTMPIMLCKGCSSCYGMLLCSSILFCAFYNPLVHDTTTMGKTSWLCVYVLYTNLTFRLYRPSWWDKNRCITVMIIASIHLTTSRLLIIIEIIRNKQAKTRINLCCLLMLWESNHSTRILWESWFCPFHAKIRNGLDLIFLIIWIKNMGYKINICMRNFIWGYSIGRCQDLPLQSRIIALGSKMHIYWITPIIHYRLHSYKHVVRMLCRIHIWKGFCKKTQ